MEEPREIQLPQLPFITREMFDWGSKAELDLETVVVTDLTGDFVVAGATKESTFAYSMAGDGVLNFNSIVRRIAGIPIFLTVHVSAVTVTPGEMWVEVFLRANGVRLFKLVAGYISFDRSLSYPIGSGNQPAQEETIPVPFNEDDPAVATNLSIGPGTNEVWVVYSLSLRLVTDATAADRRVHLRLVRSGAVAHLDLFPSVNQTASTDKTYVFQATGALQDAEDDNIIPVLMPAKIYVPRVTTIQTSVVNLQAGDQISDVQIMKSIMLMNI